MINFYIDPHGCAKNQTDGELITGFLQQAGYNHTTKAEEADFIIINSCGFIESAKKESIDAIYSIHAAYPKAKIILTGCLAERYADTLQESIPELDGIFGNGDISKIAAFMDKVSKGNRQVEVYPQEGICGGNRPLLYNFKGSAFVKITEGCSNHCSFCAIPIIRGEVRSRPYNQIIEEIKGLIADGIYEINLIGQDLAAYGTGEPDKEIADYAAKKSLSPLAVLLSEISNLEGNFLVRLLYIHPDHFNEDILPIMKKDNRFAKYFDIPFQSGDDVIIKAMNRVGDSNRYVNLVKKLREELPGCVLRTTFLTGFPGEDDSNAKNTAEFLKAIQPDWSGCFPYSREEDTPAYSFKKRVPAKVAKKRADTLEEIQSEITQNRLKQYLGQEVNVLIEEIIQLNEQSQDKSEGLALGRGWFQAPEVDGCVVVRYEADDEKEACAIKPGNLVKVKILAITGVDLDSRFISLENAAPDTKRKFLY